MFRFVAAFYSGLLIASLSHIFRMKNEEESLSKLGPAHYKGAQT
jgi:hypothetical protein